MTKLLNTVRGRRVLLGRTPYRLTARRGFSITSHPVSRRPYTNRFLAGGASMLPLDPRADNDSHGEGIHARSNALVLAGQRGRRLSGGHGSACRRLYELLPGLIELDVDGRAAPAIAELRAIAAEVPLPDKPVSIFPASFVEGSAWSRRRPCVTCGVDMMGTGSFCCDPCAAESKRRHLKPRIARKREVRIFACLQCGNEFTPKVSTARFCTTRCRVAAHYWRQRAGPA